MRIVHRVALLLIAAAAVAGWAEQVSAQRLNTIKTGTSRFEIEGRLDKSGVIHYRETIRIERGRQPLPPLTRQLQIARASFPLRQRVDYVRVTDMVGTPLPFRTRSYGEVFNIDLLAIPEEIKTGIVIEYEVHRGFDMAGAEASLQWQLLGARWSVPITDLRLRFTLPSLFKVDAIEQTLAIDSAQVEKAKMPLIRIVGDTLEWRYAHLIEPGRSMSWRMRFPSKNVQPATAGVYVEDLLRDTGFVLLFLALMLGLVPVLLFAPPSVVIGITRLWNIGAVAVAVYAIGESATYWLFDGAYRSTWGGVLTRVSVDVGFAGGLIAYALVQERMLRRGDRAAWFTQLALPVVLALPLPMYSTNVAALFLPLLGLPVAVFWLRRRIAMQFGVGTQEIVDEIAQAGELTLDELAVRVGIPEPQLRKLLAALPALPVVCDFSSGRCYSASVVAGRPDLVVCPSCGGASDISGADASACQYCQADYAQSRAGLPTQKPVPLLVEGLTRIAQVLSVAIMLWGAALLLGGLASAILDATIGEPVIVGSVVGGATMGLGLWFYGRAGEFRQGYGYGVLRGLTALTAPLIVPALAFIMLGKNRVRLHFGVYGTEHIIIALKKSGQLSLSELAELLESTIEEAAEAAEYLAASDIIDAVYDRAGARIVLAKRYTELASDGSCRACGGIMGQVDGASACHHCGELATA